MPEAEAHHRAARRSLEIIEAVAFEGGDGLSLSELARRVELPKSTAHSLVQTLAADGFLDRATAGQYVLGPRMLRLLGRLPDQFELPRVARPMMEALVDQVQETAILGVRSGMSIVYVEQVEAPQYIRYAAPLGEARPLYSSSIGKLFIATMSADELNGLMSDFVPTRFTDATKIDARQITAESRQVTAQGYALNQGETIDGVVAIAAPIYRSDDAQSPLLAGLSLAGPAERMGRQLEEIRPLVVETAKQIGLTLKPR